MNKELKKLYRKVDRCEFCRAEKNPLNHIHGFGRIKPDSMLILVNPTYRNISSNPKYQGDRFPFIGVRQFWRVLASGGFFNEKIALSLPSKSGWENNHTKQIKKELVKNKIFLTNIVKCCYNHGNYPNGDVIKDQLKLLGEEIKTVRPKRIIAFGGLVHKTLTGKNIKMSDCLNKKAVENISGLQIPVLPCYFPIGRGNPRKASEILRKIQINA